MLGEQHCHRPVSLINAAAAALVTAAQGHSRGGLQADHRATGSWLTVGLLPMHRWVSLKDKSLESEEGTQEYGVFNPCVSNAIYISYEARSCPCLVFCAMSSTTRALAEEHRQSDF